MKGINNLEIGESIIIEANKEHAMFKSDRFRSLNGKYISRNELVELINDKGDKFEFKVGMIFGQHLVLSPRKGPAFNFLKLLRNIL